MNPLCEVLLVIWLLFWIPITAVVRTVSLWLGLVKYKNVDGEVVVITGAGSGIGRLMALEFAKRNAIVALWDINEKENNLVAEEITRNGFKAHAYYCDCSKREDIYRVAKRVTDEVGEVTFLVNNAGIATGKNILDCPDNLIQKTIDINTMAHIWTLKAFLPGMVKRNHGHVVTIASGAGLFGVNRLLDYSASKFAAVGIDESLRIELTVEGKTGVKTTCVCPFYISTGMFEGVQTRFPRLLPIVTPEYAVSRITEAVLTDEPLLVMPRLVYLMYMLKGILPAQLTLAIGQRFGVTQSMDHFVQTRPKQE
ncbi:epidermal retinol dehydrogenase 2-like [Corticium candelabrum]|uniref:epidermal retinol dehydrogenase 2-like n=1 Tax=Corticium candelabrum TaxID=121492 RepID=UPI002E2524BE|nr:epidermal retinol dehydrogenase 2-like [Corticium candelabrum]